MSETCRVLFQKLISEISASRCFFIRIYLKELGWEGADGIYLVKDGDKQRSLANKVINLMCG